MDICDFFYYIGEKMFNDFSHCITESHHNILIRPLLCDAGLVFHLHLPVCAGDKRQDNHGDHQAVQAAVSI